MSRPLVSVVTPSYNQAPFLEETIRSVLDQDYPNVEYVVVDDGSTDGSVEIVRGYEDRLAWWTQQENAGQTAALNRGFARTSGKLLAYLNSDDTLLPGALSRLVAEFERDPGLVLVYGDAVYTDAESRETGYLPSRVWAPDVMVRRADNHVVQPSAMWTRRAWEEAGPFDERGYYFFDLEFFLRAGELGTVKRLAEPLSTYRLHEESKSVGAPLRKARDYVRLADDFLGGPRLPPSLRHVAARGRASAYLAAGEYFYAGLDMPNARRYLFRALRSSPALVTPRSASLALKSLLPQRAVERSRARRDRRRASREPSAPT